MLEQFPPLPVRLSLSTMTLCLLLAVAHGLVSNSRASYDPKN